MSPFEIALSGSISCCCLRSTNAFTDADFSILLKGSGKSRPASSGNSTVFTVPSLLNTSMTGCFNIIRSISLNGSSCTTGALRLGSAESKSTSTLPSPSNLKVNVLAVVLARSVPSAARVPVTDSLIMTALCFPPDFCPATRVVFDALWMCRVLNVEFS